MGGRRTEKRGEGVGREGRWGNGSDIEARGEMGRRKDGEEEEVGLGKKR